MAVQPMEMNQPIEEEPKQVGIQLSDEERFTLKMLKDLLSRGKKARAKYDSDWNKRFDFYKGKQWGDKRAAYKSRPVINIIRSTIQTILPILTDARPGFNVIPTEPQDNTFAAVMSKLVESWWDKPATSMQHTIVEVLTDSQIYDYGILKVIWDDSAEDGAGDVRVKVISPYDIFVPDEATDTNENCPWLIHRYNENVGKLRMDHPEYAEQIKADSNKPNDDDDNEDTGGTEVKVISPVDQNLAAPDQCAHSHSMEDFKMAEVVELWMDDHSTEEYISERENEETGEIEQVRELRRKYPNGRMVKALPNQNIILMDIQNPYSHGLKPFVRIIDTLLPRSFNGEGEAESLMDIQRDINKVISFIYDYQNFMSNPIWITEKGNGVNPNRLTNACGLIIQTKEGKGGTVRRDIPGSLSGDLFSFLDVLLRLAETISGVQDVTQGRKPVGVTAAQALETLQEAAQTRIRLKERNLQTSLAQLGHQIIGLFMQFYKEPRVAKIVGEGTEWPEFFEYFIEETPKGKVMNTLKYDQVKDEKGNVIKNAPQAGYVKSSPSRGIFDIKVLSGSSLPFAKAQRANAAFRLKELDVIDDMELLKSLEWPNTEELMERKRQAMQAAQAQQPQQGAQ